MRSIVPWAMPSSRIGSYSTGFTSRSVASPMFFIARTVAAMLIGFCGSYRTTTTDVRSDSAIVLQFDESDGLVAIAAKVDELPCTTAHDELTASPFSPARHLVDDHVECARVPEDFDVELIAGSRRSPLSANVLRRRPFLDGSHDHVTGFPIG